MLKVFRRLTVVLIIVFGNSNSYAFFQNTTDVEQTGVVINISDRKLYIYQNGEPVIEYPVAVGKPSHPTPTGNFQIDRIDWNPDWSPPDSEWTEGREYKTPGHPANPMGKVRIVYQAPYTIHGTEEIDSLGEDTSHGSVRMANEDVIELAKFLMKEAGVEKSESWYEEILDSPESMIQVHLPNPIPITNQP